MKNQSGTSQKGRRTSTSHSVATGQTVIPSYLEEQRRLQEERRRRQWRQQRRQAYFEHYREKEKHYSSWQWAAILGLTAAFLVLCASYLNAESTLLETMHQYSTLSTELKTLRSSNDAREAQLQASVDVEEIYRVATEELGMVYPQKHQVILYDKTESEYIKQYENIP